MRVFIRIIKKLLLLYLILISIIFFVCIALNGRDVVTKAIICYVANLILEAIVLFHLSKIKRNDEYRSNICKEIYNFDYYTELDIFHDICILSPNSKLKNYSEWKKRICSYVLINENEKNDFVHFLNNEYRNKSIFLTIVEKSIFPIIILVLGNYPIINSISLDVIKNIFFCIICVIIGSFVYVCVKLEYALREEIYFIADITEILKF